MAEVYDPVQLIVDNLILQGTEASLVSSNAVSKSYVDTHITSAIDALVNGAPAAMDTLKELSDALNASGSTLSTEILNSIASEKTLRENADAVLQTAINTEISDRVSAVSAASATLQSAINAEAAQRIASDVNASSAFQSAHLYEISRATGIEDGLATRLDGHDNSIAFLQNDKLNKSGGDVTGALTLVDSYLNFGLNWRVKASADGSKIVFQHKKADDVWRTAIPFICSV